MYTHPQITYALARARQDDIHRKASRDSIRMNGRNQERPAARLRSRSISAPLPKAEPAR